MKILSFKLGGHVSFGPKVKKEEAVWDVLAIQSELQVLPSFSSSIVDGIALGFDFVEQIRKLVEAAEKSDNANSFKREFTESNGFHQFHVHLKILCVLVKTMMNMQRKWVQRQHQRI